MTAALNPRTTAKVGAGLAIVASALVFASANLGAPPAPSGHSIVVPAPQQPTVLGRGTLPARHLPNVLAG
ncbi:hypothetical protein [Mycobacterium sp. OAE908]|uniref:hypothetical protein n=1 Tax=Mycobacterium sp. OAE908 TaxID=2817899 RepID=UPI001AE6E350